MWLSIVKMTPASPGVTVSRDCHLEWTERYQVSGSVTGMWPWRLCLVLALSYLFLFSPYCAPEQHEFSSFALTFLAAMLFQLWRQPTMEWKLWNYEINLFPLLIVGVWYFIPATGNLRSTLDFLSSTLCQFQTSGHLFPVYWPLSIL